MIEVDKIYNIDCLDLMRDMETESVDVILTSPPYNTNKKGSDKRTTKTVNEKHGEFTYARYDGYNDNLSNDDYCAFVAKCFNSFNRILKKDGVILWNASYGNENANAMFLALNTIISNGFTIADVISWKRNLHYQTISHPTKLRGYVNLYMLFVVARNSKHSRRIRRYHRLDLLVKKCILHSIISLRLQIMMEKIT